MVNNVMQVDSTTGRRKINKPLIEKKRRARINNCLEQLKKLVLEATGRNSESALNSKLEKADILEMTVQYLERLQGSQLRRRTTTASPSTIPPTPYHTGYTLCTSQAVRYLELNIPKHENTPNFSPINRNDSFTCTVPTNRVEEDIHCRLSDHLNSNIRYKSNINTCESSNNSLNYNMSENRTQERMQCGARHDKYNSDHQTMSSVTVDNISNLTINAHGTQSNSVVGDQQPHNQINSNVWRPW